MSDPRKPDRPRRPVSREGVVYTPAHAAEDSGATKRVPTVRAATRPASSVSGRKKPPKKTSTGFAVFFIATVLIGVVACVIAFALALNAMRKNAEASASASVRPGVTPPAPTSTAQPGTSVNDRGVTSLAVILAINSADRSVSLYDVSHSRQLSFTIDGTIPLRDKFGQSIVFAELAAGDIIDITCETDTEKLMSIQVSAQAWVRTGVTGVKVDVDNRRVIVGNEKFEYGNYLFARHNGVPFDIAELDSVDTVTMRGYQNALLYVAIEKSHGFITVERNSSILNGSVEIGMETYSLEDAAKSVKAPEGTYRVVVTGSNISRYETEVTVTAGETASVGLGGVQLRAGRVTIAVNEPGARVTLNDQPKNISVPILLDYGDYVLRVEKEGFEPYEEAFTFREASKDFSIALQPLVKTKRFNVVTSPSGADVYLDNVYVGISPLIVEAEYGVHTLTLRKADYVDVGDWIIVVSDDMGPNVSYMLQPISGVLMPDE